MTNTDPPTRNEYRAENRPQLTVVPGPPPPATPVLSGWGLVDECLWAGHRFVLLVDPEEGGHRIDVDGVEVWTTADPDPDTAAAELARRMSAVGDPVVDEDLDDEDNGSSAPRGQVPEAGEGIVSIDRRPLLEDWQRSPAAATAAARSLAVDFGYRMAYRFAHPFRTSRAMLGLWFTGLWWLIVRWWLWTFDADVNAQAARAKALAAESSRTADKTGLEWRADHRATVARRVRAQAIALALMAIGWVAGAVVAWSSATELDPTAGFEWIWWTPSPAVAALLLAVGAGVPMRIGKAVRPVDAGPVLDPPITVRRVPDLRRNPGLILDGFEGLGGGRTAAAYRRQREDGITACAWESEPMTTYAGDGKTPVGLLAKVRTPEPARIMLKSNKEPEAVMAQAIGRSADQVKLHYDEDDPANVVTVFVSQRQLKDMTDIPWPLASRRHQRVNFFEPVPFGFDEYGQTMLVTMNGKHGLIGGATDTGKSSGARALIAALMFDPRVQLYAYFKIGPDAHPFEPVGHRVRSGNDAEDVRHLVADLQEVIEEAKRRGKFQESHPELFPDGHVTETAWRLVHSNPTLMAELRPSGLNPIVVYIDECRFMFLDPEVGPLLEWLCAQARSLGISVLLATQYPDKHAVPTSIKSNLLLRICLLVKGEAGQRVVLGDGVAARAYVPRVLPEKGMQYSTAPEWASRGAVRGRFFWTPIPDIRTHMEHAATARRARGQLTGMAAGDTPPDPSADTILDHVASLGPFGGRIHGQDLAVLLAERHAQYAGVDPTRILGMLRDLGVDSPQVNTEVRYGPDAGQRRNRNGIRRADFDTAYARHLEARDAADAERRQLPTWADTEPDTWADTSPDTDGDPWPDTTPDTDADNGEDW